MSTPTVSKADYDDVRRKLDLATRLLCDVLRAWPDKKMSPALRLWKNQHDELDRKRLERERLDQEADALEEKVKMIRAKAARIK